MRYKIKILDNVIPNSYRDDINDKIHPVDKEKANAEIEQGEITFSPETGMLHKATGKKHSKGGTPVNLDEGSFIFSDFKDTSLNKKDIKQMEFKTGGSYKPKANTPAKVLNREIDIIHHNHLIDITQNPKKHDNITKDSAEMMLKKNLETIGQIAFKQEQKKQFPNGQPEFAKGTAPVYTPDMDKDIDQAKQYKPLSYTPNIDKYKDGGSYIPKYLQGAVVKCPCGVEADGVTCIKNCPDTIWNGLLSSAPKVGTFSPGYTPTYTRADGTQLAVSYSQGAKSRIPYNGPLASNADWSAFLKTPKGIAYTANLNNSTQPNANYQQIAPAMIPATPVKDVAAPTEIIDPTNPLNIGTGNAAGKFSPKSEGTVYNTPLTAWQKINAALPLIEGAMVETQYPMRQHVQSYIPKMDMMNSQAMENQLNQGYFNAAQQNRLNTNPAMAIAGNQELAGNRMDKLNEVIGNIINQNTTLSNNEKQQTAAILNSDAGQNRVFDDKYDTQLKTALLNTKDFKDMKRHQFLDILNPMIKDKLAFDSALNSQKQYATDEIINKAAVAKGAEKIYRSRALYEPVANFFGLNTRYTPNLNIKFQDLAGINGNKEDNADEVSKILMDMLKNGTPAEKIAASNNLTKLYGVKNLRPKQQQ